MEIIDACNLILDFSNENNKHLVQKQVKRRLLKEIIDFLHCPETISKYDREKFCKVIFESNKFNMKS